jgi:hypothetical protein
VGAVLVFSGNEVLGVILAMVGSFAVAFFASSDRAEGVWEMIGAWLQQLH